jgi:hypothetical protein
MPKIHSTRAPGNIPGNATIGGKVTSYNGVATAGAGVSPTVAYGSLTGATTNLVTVATFTPTNAGVFEVGGFVAATAYTSGNVGLRLMYTDSQGSAQNYVLQGEVASTGGNNNVLTATGVLAIFTQTISVQAGSAITLQTNLTGTATANFRAFIRQVN